MRSSRPSPDRQATVSRRLARLGAELAAARSDEQLGTGAATPAELVAPDTHTRIRPGRNAEPTWEPTPADPEPPAAPTSSPEASSGPDPAWASAHSPGRHAARRSRWSTERGLASRPQLALGAAQLAVVGLVVLVGVAVSLWWWQAHRAQPQPVDVALGEPLSLTTSVGLDEPEGTASIGGDAGDAAAGDAGAGARDSVVVDVAGRVRHPGIAVLGPGARVVDAIGAAGGARRGVDLTTLNLARLLVDGEQILVGVRAPAGVAGPMVGVVPGDPVAVLVNINTAGQAELESLPEVGPVTAQAIIAWRQEHGGFSNIDQLLDVDGIGEATLSEVAPHVTV
jgi:competence protein ComEA